MSLSCQSFGFSNLTEFYFDFIVHCVNALLRCPRALESELLHTLIIKRTKLVAWKPSISEAFRTQVFNALEKCFSLQMALVDMSFQE